MPSGNLELEDFVPALGIGSDMYGHVSHLDMACNRFVHPLAAAHRQHLLSDRAQNEVLGLCNFAALVANVLSSLYGILDLIRQFIIADSGTQEMLPTIAEAYDTLLRALDSVSDEGQGRLCSLRAFQRHLMSTMSYPPIIHYLAVHLLSSSHSPRHAVLTKVPPVIDGICGDIQSVVDLAVLMKDSAKTSRQRFSVSTLVGLRDHPKSLRMQVGSLAKQAAWEFYSHARSARETSQYIRRLGVPIIPYYQKSTHDGHTSHENTGPEAPRRRAGPSPKSKHAFRQKDCPRTLDQGDHVDIPRQQSPFALPHRFPIGLGMRANPTS